MADSSKIPLQHTVRGTRLSPTSVPADRSLRLLVWPAIAALIGLGCSIQSTILLSYVVRMKVANAYEVLSIIVVVVVNISAVVIISALSQKRLAPRLLLAFIVAFLVHFTWFSFAAAMNQEVLWSFVPATYLAAVALSMAVDPLARIRRRGKIGVIVAGVEPEILRRLGPDIELVCDLSVDGSQYDALLLDYAVPLTPEWARFVASAALTNCEVRHVRSYVIECASYLLPEDVDRESILCHLRMSGPYSAAKRSIDIVATLLMAPIALMLSAIAASAIAVSMGRPIIFVQDRVGRHGRIFRMYKLRTMSARGLDEKQTATSKGDYRITPLGRVLRRYRIDELPQLFNVLKGDMSLIGPRPEQPQLVAEYQGILPNYDLRHAVQPGLSGWAQVSFGYASNVDETRTKLTYDLYYIKEFGLALDVEIAVATVWTLLTGRNAR